MLGLAPSDQEESPVQRVSRSQVECLVDHDAVHPKPFLTKSAPGIAVRTGQSTRHQRGDHIGQRRARCTRRRHFSSDCDQSVDRGSRGIGSEQDISSFSRGAFGVGTMHECGHVGR